MKINLSIYLSMLNVKSVQNRVLLISVGFLLLSKFTYSQESTIFYKLKGETILQECSATGDSIGIKAVPGGSKFTIVNLKGDNYIIRFWQWQVDTTEAKALNTKTDSRHNKNEKQIKSNYEKYLNFNVDISKSTSTLRYFIISKSAIDFFTEKITQKWSATYGVAVLPFKYRSQNGDFLKDLSISNLGGIKLSPNNGKCSVSLLIGIGISSVTLDSLNTSGIITKQQDRAAITLPIGLVLQYEKLQIGLFTGWDWLSKRSIDGWDYQGKNWLALGIGISIFSDEKATKKEGGQ
jgi:hypothetical protein